MTYVRSPDIDLVQSEVVTYLTRKARKTPFKLVDKCGRVVGEVDPVARSIEILKKAGFIFEHEAGRKQTVCAGWNGHCEKNAIPPRKAFAPAHVKKRGGKPWRCMTCASLVAHHSKTEDERKTIAARTNAGISHEKRSEAAKKFQMSRRCRDRRESARKAALTVRRNKMVNR